MEPIAYTINESVKISRISRTKLYEAISQGRLKAKKLGTRTLITADALNAFVAALPDLPSGADD